MTTPLQKAAQSVIDRWDSPAWKNQPHTAEYIEGLRKALVDELAQSVEPYGWMAQGVPVVMLGEFGKEVQTQYAKRLGGSCYAYPVYLHPPQPQASMSEEWTAWQAEGESLIEGKNNGVLFALGEWWADRPWRTKP